MNTTREATPSSVPARDKQGGDAVHRPVDAEPEVWTERMLTALTGGMKGNRWFSLIDKVYADRTLELAWAKVRANAGGSGVDRITVDRFAKDCPRGLLDLKEQVRMASYQPLPVKRTWIPKPGTNEQRPLGIPTVCANCTQEQRVLGMGCDHASVPSVARPTVPDSEDEDLFWAADGYLGGWGLRHVFGSSGMD